MKQIITFLFSIMLLNCYSQYDFQAGYIITLESDSLFGLIDVNKALVRAEYCYFKEDNTKDIIEYSPNTISEYGLFNDRKYISRNIKLSESNIKLFLEPIFEGCLNIYFARYQGKDYYFVEKDKQIFELNNDLKDIKKNGKTYKVESNEYKGILIWLMSDVKGFNEKIQETKLNQTSLVELATLYHMSKSDLDYSSRSEENKRYNSTWHFNFGISAGSLISNASLNYGIYNPSVLPSDYNWFNFDLQVPKYASISSNMDISSKSVAAYPEVYLSLDRNSRAKFDLGICYQSFKVEEIKLKRINVPISYCYDLSRYKKIVPYFIIGISSNYYLKPTIEGEYYINYSVLDEYLTNEEPIYVTKKYNLEPDHIKSGLTFNYHIGLGIKYYLENGKNLAATIVYNPTSLNIEENEPINNATIKVHQISISLSYSLFTYSR